MYNCYQDTVSIDLESKVDRKTIIFFFLLCLVRFCTYFFTLEGDWCILLMLLPSLVFRAILRLKLLFLIIFLGYLFDMFVLSCFVHSYADSFSKPISGSDEPQQGGWFRTFTVAAYKPYFDVDTSDVLERIIDSLFPFRGSFNEKTATNPDLWVDCLFLMSLIADEIIICTLLSIVFMESAVVASFNVLIYSKLNSRF